jgi:hypothetical protein
MNLHEYLIQEAHTERSDQYRKEKVAEALSGQPNSALNHALGVLEKTSGVLTLKKRESLPKGDFAMPEKKVRKGDEPPPGDAKGKYPIPDLAHARNALARVAQHGTPAEQAAVRAKVYAKYPELKERAQKRDEKPTEKQSEIEKVSTVRRIRKVGSGAEYFSSKAAKSAARQAKARRERGPVDTGFPEVDELRKKAAWETYKKYFGEDEEQGVKEKIAEAQEHGRDLARQHYRRMLAVSDPEAAVRHLYKGAGVDLIKTAALAYPRCHRRSDRRGCCGCRHRRCHWHQSDPAKVPEHPRASEAQAGRQYPSEAEVNWDLFDKEIVKLALMAPGQPRGETPTQIMGQPSNLAGVPAPQQPPPQPKQVAGAKVRVPGVKTPVIPSATNKGSNFSSTLSAVKAATNAQYSSKTAAPGGMLQRAIRRIFARGVQGKSKTRTVSGRPKKQSLLTHVGLPLAAGAGGLWLGKKLLRMERDESLDHLRRAGLVEDDRPTIESTQLNTE